MRSEHEAATATAALWLHCGAWLLLLGRGLLLSHRLLLLLLLLVLVVQGLLLSRSLLLLAAVVVECGAQHQHLRPGAVVGVIVEALDPAGLAAHAHIVEACWEASAGGHVAKGAGVSVVRAI